MKLTGGSPPCLALVAVLLIFPAPGESQEQSSGPGPVPAASIVPAPPLAPDVIARDSQGRVTVRATQLSEPLVIDGRLDEEVYTSVRPFGDFIQADPHEGQPATDKTDVWVCYDSKNVYISLRVWYSHPDTIIANEMRRDGQPVWSTNDNIGVLLDTFHDRRSGFYLNTNALGAVRDALLTDEERNASLDFNLVWDVKSRRFEQGWTTEMVVPFKSRFASPQGASRCGGFRFSGSIGARMRCRISRRFPPRSACLGSGGCRPPRRSSASRRHRAAGISS